MSVIFENQLSVSNNECDVYPKDSFIRFGDDLAEYLLSYLQFDNKFHFECVSKQFQRLIFNRVDWINVTNQYNLSTVLGPFHYRKKINIDAFEAVLKKCPNIRRIYATADAINEEEVFRTIIKNCNRLHEIESDFESLTDETIDEFCAKFGPNLKKINFIPNNATVKKILRLSPNIEMIGYDWISLEDFFDSKELLVNRLKSFSFYYFPEDIERITTFVESNRNTLRSLEMIVYDRSLTTFHTNCLFKELTKLSKLKTLGIFYYVDTDSSFVNFIRKLSDHIDQLTKVDFDLQINSPSDLLKVYKSLNSFQKLKTIYLRNHRKSSEPLIPIISEDLKDLKNLCHIKISGDTFIIGDEFFTGIDKHLPQLLILNITNMEMSSKGLAHLSKMPELRHLSMTSTSLDTLIQESDVHQFILKTRKLQSIYILNVGIACDLQRTDIELLKQTDTSFTEAKVHSYKGQGHFYCPF